MAGGRLAVDVVLDCRPALVTARTVVDGVLLRRAAFVARW